MLCLDTLLKYRVPKDELINIKAIWAPQLNRAGLACRSATHAPSSVGDLAGESQRCNEPSLTSLRVAGWTAGGWPGGDPDRLHGPRLIYQAIIGWAPGETLKVSIISALLQRFIITAGGERWMETPGRGQDDCDVGWR